MGGYCAIVSALTQGVAHLYHKQQSSLHKRIIVKKIILLCISLLFFGCGERIKITPGQNVIGLADAQRHKVLDQTREGSYSVFPDTDDAKKLEDPTFLDAMHAERPNGSAFAVRPDGLVVTNVHVIQGTNFCTGRANLNPKGLEDTQREVGRLKEEIAREDGTKETFCLFVTQAFTKAYRAKLMKMDEVNDIALLCLEHPSRPIPFLALAQPHSFGEGAEVLTIGSPMGNVNMMTPGYISNLNFVPEDRETGKKMAQKTQFSAPILPGNSGGPLVSVATGEVVGQVVAIITVNGIPTQMSYANPVEYLRENIRNTPSCEKK